MNRYPGVSNFTPDQKELFFGRYEDIEHIEKLIRTERKILLYAKSGIGKTSLLKAGVLPRFQNDNSIKSIEIRFSYSNDPQTPVQKLKEILTQSKDLQIKQGANTILSKFIPDKDNLWWFFKSHQLSINEKNQILLIFDQFEELFLYSSESIEEFKNVLAEIVNPNSLPSFFNEFEDVLFQNKEYISESDLEILYSPLNLKFIFIIRSDRLSYLNLFSDKIPDIQKVFYELKPLNRCQIKQAIVEPAKLIGNYNCPSFKYNKETLEKIVDYLTSDGSQIPEATQLQLICQRIETQIIYKSQLNAQSGNLVASDNELPELKGLFHQFYKDSINSLDVDKREKASELIEVHLIHDGHRFSVKSDFCEEILDAKSLSKLENIHLLRREENPAGGFYYELSHDNLVTPIMEEVNLRIKKKKQLEQQRRLWSIILIISFIAVLSGVFGYYYYQQFLEVKDLNKKTDIQYIDKMLDKVMSSISANQYAKAINILTDASQFIESKPELKQSYSTKIDSLSSSCKQAVEQIEKFTPVFTEAKLYLKKAKNVNGAEPDPDMLYKAKLKFIDAKGILSDYDSLSIYIAILEGQINEFVNEAKSRSESYISRGQKDYALSQWIQPALLLKPDDRELLILKKRCNQ